MFDYKTTSVMLIKKHDRLQLDRSWCPLVRFSKIPRTFWAGKTSFNKHNVHHH